ncbi:alpha/beta hydrolase [Nocardia sp. CDC159]|uniref:Alpha/beta hydrolase n=1 Tax=Nocardia pulmonis TaxID=2951408 RepID=A0A9X2EIR7_9NOCA|nr:MULTISPECIES: alpha/beta hydrolase [Nocardia]MCM6778876.1 alpha/beta hydrolase [Nocardia pulmonis]MCM6791765.1 alpha/beta hydrolase [Nocardia sp. CDC159]
MRMPRLLVPLAAATLLLSVCVGDALDPANKPARDAYYDQNVRWKHCAKGEGRSWFLDIPADGRLCARILVPLDYRGSRPVAPGRVKSVSLAVARLVATGEKHGTLVLISGGPGQPGLGMLDMPFPEPIRRHYDIVSYDPRGVGRSTPAIHCAWNSAELLDEQDSATATEAARREFVDSCVNRTGARVLRHIGSDEATDDLDIIRGVLGEQRLNLLAASYGTQIAAMYIDRYPQGYRAAALDGVVDVTEGFFEMWMGQMRGYQDTFNRVAAYCAGPYRTESRGECPLGGDPAKAQNVFHGILRGLHERPAPADERAPVEPGTVLQAMITGFLWPEGWAPFLDALVAIQHGDGTPMRKLANEEYDETPPRTPYDSILSDNALVAITCADIAEPTSDRAARQADLAALHHAATYDDYRPRPTEFPLGTCDFWPTPGTAKAYRPHRANGSPPVLFIGTRHDPTTPLRNAERMAQYLQSPLLIREGDGHTFVFNDVNSCIDDLVVRYFENPPAARSAICD